MNLYRFHTKRLSKVRDYNVIVRVKMLVGGVPWHFSM